MMNWRKALSTLTAFLLTAFAIAACSDDVESFAEFSDDCFFAVLSDDDSQPRGFSSEDIVLRLSNIEAFDPATGKIKINDAQRINAVAFPLPTQHYIHFFSNDDYLFSAKLSHAFSSMMVTGLTMTYWMTDQNNASIYEFSTFQIVDDDKVIEGSRTDQQKSGLKRMQEILQSTGKVKKVDYPKWEFY